MKKLLVLISLFPLLVFGQAPTSTSKIPLSIPPVYVAQLNGSTQYFSKTSPVNMDLNGAERIPSAQNRDFDSTTTIGGWFAVGNHSISRVTTDSYSSPGSLQIVSTGAGDGGSHYITLFSASFNPFVVGEKYTVQVRARATLSNTKLTFQHGGIAGQTGNLSNTPGTFTLAVFNGAPPASTSLRLYLSQADTVYLDAVSLTQAYDGVASLEAKTTGGSTQTLAGSSKSNGSRLRIWQNTATASVTLTDGTTSVTATNSATVNDGRDHQWDVTWSRTGNLTLYIDGVAGTGQSITGVGAVTVDTLWIGRDEAGNSFTGTIGEKLRVRYPSLPTNIATWIAFANTQRFIPEPPGGGTVVLRLFGKYNDAYDRSGNQGVLTNNGSTPIIQK